MNHDQRLFSDAVLDDAAAEWLCEREQGFAPERAEAFARWRDSDERHAAAVARVEQTFALLVEMPAVRESLEMRFGRAKENGNRPTLSRNPFPRTFWLAAAAAVALVGGLWWGGSARLPRENHFAALANAPRRVTLPDASTLDLNTSSDVRVHFTTKRTPGYPRRRRGAFPAIPDAARPFIVEAAGISVRAVGTAFTVRLAASAVDVVVVEGKVEVVRPSSPTADEKVERPQLSAGERASIPLDKVSSAPQIEKVDAAAIRQVLAWQDPVTTFADVPLREIVARFNRRNAVQLSLLDDNLGDRRMGGVFALDQVGAFVRLLEQDGDIIADRREPGVVVLRRAR